MRLTRRDRKTSVGRAMGMLGLTLAVAGVAMAGAGRSLAAPGGNGGQFTAVCALPGAAQAACNAIRVTGSANEPSSTPGVSGYDASDLQSAYNLAGPAGSNGSGTTVAIVDAYNDPTVRLDLCTYRSTFKLPALQGCSGATTGPSLTVVGQDGSSTLPANNSNWAQEISLDVDMVSAICPNCNILLVEANSANLSDLGVAENRAATLGAAAISNSWGGKESSSDTSYDTSYFNHPGIAITVSSGDSGYGAQYPASSQYVTAVGGTSLSRSSTSRGWSEKAWTCSGSFSCLFFGGAGSGCSAYDAKPAWQKDTGCTRRTVADVSAVADPNTGVAVYYNGGWTVFGGTSVASPIIAAVYALAGNASSLTYGSYPYGHTSSLNDVTADSSSTVKCTPSYLCNAQAGYDGPTGLGTPNGTAAF